VVEPQLTPDDLLTIPEWDLDMLIDIANRMQSEDAEGKPIGVTPLSAAAGFRDEPGSDHGGSEGS